MVVNFGNPLPNDAYSLEALCLAAYSTPETLDALADLTEEESDSIDLHPWIAINKNTSAVTLDKIMNSAIKRRTALSYSKLASHKNISGETLHKLFKIIEPGDLRVIEAISENKNISKETAIVLAQHKQIHIRCNLARNPGTPGYIVERMASPKYLKGVKKTLAVFMLTNIVTSLNVSSEFLHKMLTPEVFYPGVETQDNYQNILLALAKNPAISLETMKILAANDDLQGEIAMNPAITEEVAEYINYDTITPILAYNLRYNKKANSSVIRKMVRSSDPGVSKLGCSAPGSLVEDIYYAGNVLSHDCAREVLVELKNNEFVEMVREEYNIDITGYSKEMIYSILSWDLIIDFELAK
jgi:hypothetical protein